MFDVLGGILVGLVARIDDSSLDLRFVILLVILFTIIGHALRNKFFVFIH